MVLLEVLEVLELLELLEVGVGVTTIDEEV